VWYFKGISADTKWYQDVWYGDGASNAVEKNSSVFSLITLR